MTNAYAYAEITKADKQPDGTLMVTGIVSDTGLDRDRQRMSADFLRKGLGAWFTDGGANVREQHNSLIAAGVGVELSDAGGDRWVLKSHIVDPGTVAKVLARVLKGYSIAATGCRIQKGLADAPNGLVVDGTIYEVSLVDSPSRASCKISIAKSHDGQLQLSDADDQDDDEPDDETKDEEMTLKSYTAAQDLVEQALTGELVENLVKAASAAGALSDVTSDAIGQIAGLVAAEARALQQDAEAGELLKGHNLGGLARAVEALRTFVDPDAERLLITVGVDEDGATLRKSFTGWVESTLGEDVAPGESSEDVTKSGGPATVGDAEIQKAVREAQAPLLAEVESLRGQMAKVLSTQIPGGPVITKSIPTQRAASSPYATELASIERRLQNPNVGSEMRAADIARKAEILGS